MSDTIRGSARITRGQVEVNLTLALPEQADGAAPLSVSVGADQARPIHGPDFASVNWFGTVYAFSPKQRVVVAALFRARAEGHEWLSQETLLDLAESDCGRIRDLFRGHPAWGEMIVSAVPSGGPAGSYRLAGIVSQAG